ncbi:hypothetical protein CHS0354_042005 [Potamilus streckersoni]|uniref:Uncharacterized protein n=1 Tax=Potamilus streckersoni TaxID=2493646 RepID=A0AAE0TAN9_9BIVA|nr:hypothetical protein CHS0354_042005 [Potamilus streckersoni]
MQMHFQRTHSDAKLTIRPSTCKRMHLGVFYCMDWISFQILAYIHEGGGWRGITGGLDWGRGMGVKQSKLEEVIIHIGFNFSFGVNIAVLCRQQINSQNVMLFCKICCFDNDGNDE